MNYNRREFKCLNPKMTIQRVFLLLFVSLLFESASWAAILKCPLKKTGLPFAGLSLFDGNPKKQMDLKPDNGDSPLPHVWAVDSSVTPWLGCKYGTKNEILFSKVVKAHVTFCKTIESMEGSGKFDAIECK